MSRSRSLLILLTIWALAMIVPDLSRVVRPLSSFGFYANGDGLIYDVTGPFEDEAQSPAWKAGLRAGDQLDLGKMRCIPYVHDVCASTLAAVGGNLFVTPGDVISLDIQTAGQDSKQVTLTAEQRPVNWLVRLVLLFDEIAGIAVVLAAAWLVWMRPGAMSWGFFLYALWFNPGQSFEFYALLQRVPWLLLMQDVAGSIAQAAGYAGLLLFVIRAPNDRVQPEWQRVERALPWLAAVLALWLLSSYASAFGFKTEMLTRATILFGLVVSIAAVAVLLLRRQSLTPKDNQRLRWVLWGSVIGLPAFVLADLAEYTTLFASLGGGISIPEDVIGLLYLVNGILCLFVFEAVRRPRVVSVSIPLRRVTLLALSLSLPALLLHKEAEHLQEKLDVPQWAWFVIGAVLVFAIGQLHHGAVELVDRYFNRDLDRAELEIGEAILAAKEPATIDHLLSDGVLRTLKLDSAATFRRTNEVFHRYENGVRWDAAATRRLDLDAASMSALIDGETCVVGADVAKTAGMPLGIETPLLAVPAASRVHCFAATLYGPHESGTDIDGNERAVLESLGRHAADAYARLENEALRAKIAELSAVAVAR